MVYIQNPTINGKCEKQDLRKYAYSRKEQEIEDIKCILEDKRVINGIIEQSEHDEYREPLAFDRKILIDIQLSTGGDADGFKLTFDDTNNLVSGVYYWADWGVYEEIRLSDEELELVDNLYSISDWLSCS